MKVNVIVNTEQVVVDAEQIVVEPVPSEDFVEIDSDSEKETIDINESQHSFVSNRTRYRTFMD